MNYGQMQTELAKMLGNMTASTNPTWYPLIVPAGGQEATGILTRAANRYVEMVTDGRPDLNAAELFPELGSVTFDLLTVAGANEIARPTSIIAITKISSADQNTAPNWAIIDERPLDWIPLITLGQLQKDTTVTGYPTLYSRRADNVCYHPTTDASTTTYLRLYGLRAEAVPASTNASFLMSERRHNAVVTLAAAMMAEKMGWTARAQGWYASVKFERDSTMSANAQERPQHIEIEIEDAPTWSSVNSGVWG